MFFKKINKSKKRKYTYSRKDVLKIINNFKLLIDKKDKEIENKNKLINYYQNQLLKENKGR